MPASPRPMREAVALASAKVSEALKGAAPTRVVSRPPRLVNVVDLKRHPPLAATPGRHRRLAAARRRPVQPWKPASTSFHSPGSTL